ncbi:hypothetical protein K1719_004134 [Acacia pycnantha]|nr:hypothetical protein K1719_004134 [Acacia pycnantha]
MVAVKVVRPPELSPSVNDTRASADKSLNGKSFIRCESITFRRTKESAALKNERQQRTGLVEAIIVKGGWGRYSPSQHDGSSSQDSKHEALCKNFTQGSGTCLQYLTWFTSSLKETNYLQDSAIL